MPKKGQFKVGAKPRSVKQRAYNSKPKSKKQRAGRNKARGQALGRGLVSKGDGMDIDHINRNPLDNRTTNIRKQPKSINRSRNGRK